MSSKELLWPTRVTDAPDRQPRPCCTADRILPASHDSDLSTQNGCRVATTCIQKIKFHGSSMAINDLYQGVDFKLTVQATWLDADS